VILQGKMITYSQLVVYTLVHSHTRLESNYGRMPWKAQRMNLQFITAK